ncbi:aquaporin-like protein [Xylona heveae TC161]|uniref:Aquaporin-like protein n=1 Tax=Xylona heveae (strain CBS 132557 / TC161) TaxID=1328760 RepID=A0A165HE63_XYLHT|nr:aquaporin-like protein [Xylona heveae TC161]KZF23374.1 aquaporin-like protein [Xylona heveae TC161]
MECLFTRRMGLSRIMERRKFIAATLLIYLSGLIDTTLTNFDTVIIAPFVGISNIFLLALFIMAAGPGSGGHINQTITFATLLTGFTGFSRAILYMTAQTAGAALAGGVLRGAYGKARIEKYHGGGCFIDPNTVSSGQALLIEVVSSFTLLFLSFGVGLDPRQARLYGAYIGPLAVGCVLGLVTFASAGIVPGYTGASMFPGRCFAFAIARGNFSNQWVWWVGPIGGSFLQAFTYWVAPPYHSAPVPDAARERKETMA